MNRYILSDRLTHELKLLDRAESNAVQRVQLEW